MRGTPCAPSCEELLAHAKNAQRACANTTLAKLILIKKCKSFLWHS